MAYSLFQATHGASHVAQYTNKDGFRVVNGVGRPAGRHDRGGLPVRLGP